jgi:hypothetical protein
MNFQAHFKFGMSYCGDLDIMLFLAHIAVYLTFLGQLALDESDHDTNLAR